jgi:PAS domain S-box-containing protein
VSGNDHDPQFRDIADHLGAILWISDPDGERMLFCSQAYETMWGRPVAELYADAESWMEGVHPDDRDRMLAAWDRRWTGYDVEYRVIRPDGTTVHVNDVGRMVRDDAGRPLRLVGYTTDVTELKRLEEQLQHAQKMESLGRLAGGVAHEVNNLLTVVLGHARLAREHPHRIEEHTALIEEAARRGGELTARLLGLTPSMPIRAGALDLAAVVREEEAALRTLAGGACKLTITCEPGGAPVRADGDEVRRLLDELVENAADAMPGGGPIAISVSTTAYDEAAAAHHPGLQPGEHVVLTVADSGIGIPEHDRSRVFEPVFTTKRDGAGMGLTTCYGIMARASGHIRLESSPGRGTVVACAFPLGAAVAAVAREAAAPRAAGETVLVAEDEPLVRTLVAGALREQGYTVLEAGDGEEALAIADATPGLALLVTDVVMPHMDGRDLAARLRDRLPGIPVLFVSGYTDGALAEDGEPATAFLPKPFMSGELMAAVRTLLDPEPSPA